MNIRRLRRLWHLIRENRRYGGTIEPTTRFVTVTTRKADGTIRRIHHVPAEYTDAVIDFALRHDEVSIIAEEPD